MTFFPYEIRLKNAIGKFYEVIILKLSLHQNKIPMAYQSVHQKINLKKLSNLI